jgi:CRP-like cAMP-binding protein
VGQGVPNVDPRRVLANLQLRQPLTDLDRSAVENVLRNCASHAGAGSALIRAGEPGVGFALIDGWMSREIVLNDGRLQLTALFVPGDILDLDADLIGDCEYFLHAVTDVTVARISRFQLRRLVEFHPHLRDAFAWMRLQQLANKRELLVGVGRRNAAERITHFFCEIFHRLRCVGLTLGNECQLPLTQVQLAQLTGMTTVHLSRSMALLRSQELIEWQAGRLSIPDLKRLEDFACFEPSYLHRDHAARS